MRQGFGKTLLVTAAALLAVGCTSGGDASTKEPTADVGSAPPSSGGSGSSVPAQPAGPEIRNPIDPSGFLSRPCDVLSPGALQSLQAEPGEPDSSSNPGCAWNTSDGGQIGFNFNDDNIHGLNSLYEMRRTQPKSYFGYFEPTNVGGYPALFSDATDNRDSGDCSIGVGINQKTILTVSQLSGDGRKSCDVAKRAASAMISTLKGGA